MARTYLEIYTSCMLYCEKSCLLCEDDCTSMVSNREGGRGEKRRAAAQGLFCFATGQI